mmetsp:Transcript_27496/g.66739  ORF Transcript_27496/g.66739 Transcript_27496/m.66739 type:complete len:218 (-) Transcript_27496:539-1192(-)
MPRAKLPGARTGWAGETPLPARPAGAAALVLLFVRAAQQHERDDAEHDRDADEHEPVGPYGPKENVAVVEDARAGNDVGQRAGDGAHALGVRAAGRPDGGERVVGGRLGVHVEHRRHVLARQVVAAFELADLQPGVHQVERRDVLDPREPHGQQIASDVKAAEQHEREHHDGERREALAQVVELRAQHEAHAGRRDGGEAQRDERLEERHELDAEAD